MASLHNLSTSIQNRLSHGRPFSTRARQPKAIAGGAQVKDDFCYPEPLALRELLHFSIDLKSTYKSIWLGPVLICWRLEYPGRDFSISWRPD